MKLRAQLSLLFCLVVFLAACNTAAEPLVEVNDVATAEPAVENANSADIVESETEEAVAPVATTAPIATAEPAGSPPTDSNPENTRESDQSTGKTGDLTVGNVIINGADDFPLYGTFQKTSSTQTAPTVFLLHMLGGNRAVWQDFATALNETGYNTLALDMRGHGETGGSQDWTLAQADLVLVWQYLAERPDVDETRIAIIGGSIGANMALITGANVPQINTVVLLSPGLDYLGVQTETVMSDYGDRPVLIVASNEDSYAADSSITLADLAINGATQLLLYDGAGHGTNMFSRAPDLTERIVAWFNLYL